MAVDARSLAAVSRNAHTAGSGGGVLATHFILTHARRYSIASLQPLIEPDKQPVPAADMPWQAVPKLVRTNDKTQCAGGRITRRVVYARPKARGRAQAFFFWSPRSP